jgi:hypothetical protein
MKTQQQHLQPTLTTTTTPMSYGDSDGGAAAETRVRLFNDYPAGFYRAGQIC